MPSRLAAPTPIASYEGGCTRPAKQYITRISLDYSYRWFDILFQLSQMIRPPKPPHKQQNGCAINSILRTQR